MKVPKELFAEWEREWWGMAEPKGFMGDYEFFANKAAEWAYKKGADDELEACCEQLRSLGPGQATIDRLREARRPKTLNDIALKMLETIVKDGRYLPEITDTIRKALKENK